ncbi:MAG TPA: hypothetical protein VKA27_07990 [Sunxiuqinia sp.]|nr:hypothetical protein [Sunxiuqinia sp.]
MNFECKQLKIIDDPDFGCTIEFNDTVEVYRENMTIEELINSVGKYLMIQRSYPEDEFENDWYHIETSEADIDFNQKDSMYVKLNRKEFEFYCSGVTLVIGLTLSDKEYTKLDKILRTRFKDKVVMRG